MSLRAPDLYMTVCECPSQHPEQSFTAHCSERTRPNWTDKDEHFSFSLRGQVQFAAHWTPTEDDIPRWSGSRAMGTSAVCSLHGVGTSRKTWIIQWNRAAVSRLEYRTNITRKLNNDRMIFGVTYSTVLMRK